MIDLINNSDSEREVWNLKDKIIKGIILLCYCIPYSFMSINGDARYRTMIFYGIMLVCMGFLCIQSFKYHAIGYAVVGNILSAIISYLCVISFMTENRNWYFKPFTPSTLTIFISIVAFLIHLFVWLTLKRSKKIQKRKP